jgi:hypothetical protein
LPCRTTVGSGVYGRSSTVTRGLGGAGSGGTCSAVVVSVLIVVAVLGSGLEGEYFKRGCQSDVRQSLDMSSNLLSRITTGSLVSTPPAGIDATCEATVARRRRMEANDFILNWRSWYKAVFDLCAVC